MRCDQCKWWKGPDASRGYNIYDKLFGVCGRIEHREAVYEAVHNEGIKPWELARKEMENRIKMTGAYVTDASDYTASLCTVADFFCARFEPTP